MKILYIITQGEQGGAQKNVLDLATSFHNKGHEVYITTGKRTDLKDNWLTNSFSEAIGATDRTFEILNLVRDIKPASEALGVIDMVRLLRLVKPDVVHLHSVKAGILGSVAGFLCGVKVVYTVHGFTFKEPMGLLKKNFYIFAELFASLFVDEYILVSKSDLEMGRKYKILRGRKGQVIYNGLGMKTQDLLTKTDAVAAIEKLMSQHGPQQASLAGKVVYGSIGNLYKTKGYEYYLKAISMLPKEVRERLAFLIIGFGREEESLKKLKQELNLTNVYFLGKVDSAARLARAFDVFVLPSVKEGLPYCLLEASLAQLPIVASSVGGIPEIASLVPMQLVRPASPDELAAELEEFSKEEVRARNKSRFSDEFLFDEMIGKVEAVYKTMYTTSND